MNDATTRSRIDGLALAERGLTIAALLLVAAACAWLTLQAGDALMGFPPWAPVSPLWLGLLFLMWWAMMVAMMLPSAAAAILTFGGISRRLDGAGARQRQLAFTTGYIAVWTGFSLAAMVLQLAAAHVLRLDPMYATTSRAVGGALLIAAGVYQLTPLKNACLSKCQLPLFYFARNWRPGAAGAFRLGLEHGLYCLGCCAVLMGVLFYGGVMEPRWIGGLALYVLLEKLTPARSYLSRFSGVILIAWGAAVLAWPT
jgi:predicted metal-binding membrane protein